MSTTTQAVQGATRHGRTAAQQAASKDIAAVPKKRGRPAGSANAANQSNGTTATRVRRTAASSVVGNDMGAACPPGKGGGKMSGGKAGSSKGQPAAVKAPANGTGGKKAGKK